MLGLMDAHVFNGLIIDWYLFVILYFIVCNCIYWNCLMYLIFAICNYIGDFNYTCIY